MSILAVYASPPYTNYIKVLIKNGADVDEAINWHRKYGFEEAALLIEKIDEEVKSNTK